MDPALISQFIAITGADQDRAKFFLESAGWDVQLAVESYFEDGDNVSAVPGSPSPPENNRRFTSNDKSSSNDPSSDDDIKIINESRPKSLQPSLKPRGTQKSVDKRFATLSDLNFSTPEVDPNSSDSESEHHASSTKKDDRQAFYVGGSTESGQQVLGPTRDDANQLIDRLLKKANTYGTKETLRETEAAKNKPLEFFKCAGMRLGDSISGSSLVPGEKDPSTDDDSKSSHHCPVARITVALYRNGFIVDQGSLRSYDDPQSRQFIASVMRQQIPHELTVKYRNSEIDLHLENHQTEDYIQPKGFVESFSGRGYMLGSPVPKVVGDGGECRVKAGPSDQLSNSKRQPLKIDESLPITRIQIRTLDGRRLIGRFNHVHTINDLRTFVDEQSTSQPNGTAYIFAAVVPPKTIKLTDESKTLQDEGLLNGSVCQVPSS